MKKSGAKIFALDAVDLLIIDSEKIIATLTKKALGIAHHAKRKKIAKEDMDLN